MCIALFHHKLSAAQYRHLLVLALSLLLVGCGPAVHTEQFVEPSTGRVYRVMTASTLSATTSTPVLFSLHAYATPADVVLDGYSVLQHAVRDRGWIVVVPEGRFDGDRQAYWNASAACCGAGKRDADDMTYLRAVLNDVKRRYPVDSARVFAFGVSNGSFMALRWACTLGGDLAGVVSVAGAGQGLDDPPCQATRPISLVHVHGSADEVISFAGGQETGHRYPSARDTVAWWVRAAALAGEPQVTHRRSLLLKPVTVQTWSGNGVRVSGWVFAGADHLLFEARFFMSEYLDLISLNLTPESRPLN